MISQIFVTAMIKCPNQSGLWVFQAKTAHTFIIRILLVQDLLHFLCAAVSLHLVSGGRSVKLIVFVNFVFSFRDWQWIINRRSGKVKSDKKSERGSVRPWPYPAHLHYLLLYEVTLANKYATKARGIHKTVRTWKNANEEDHGGQLFTGDKSLKSSWSTFDWVQHCSACFRSDSLGTVSPPAQTGLRCN